MRHVDEGALHAWLDGELDALPAGEAEWIREHLEHCGACALRLDEERRVRDAAEGILAGAPVDLSGLPSLEEMRARARREAGTGGGAGGTRPRARQMAWAASIVLAAGAGWMANALFPRLQGGADPAVQFLRPDSGTLVAPSAVVRGGDVPMEADAPSQERDDLAQEQNAPPPPASAEPETSRQEEASAEKAAPAESEVRARESDLEAARLAAPPVPESLATGIAPGASAAAPVPGIRLRRALLDEAPVVAVPGLPVVSVAFLVPGDAAGGAVVRQELADGSLLEVYHLPAERTPATLPALEEGVRQWVAPREAGWLVLRGRTTEAELQALGERLLGG